MKATPCQVGRQTGSALHGEVPVRIPTQVTGRNPRSRSQPCAVARGTSPLPRRAWSVRGVAWEVPVRSALEAIGVSGRTGALDQAVRRIAHFVPTGGVPARALKSECVRPRFVVTSARAILQSKGAHAVNVRLDSTDLDPKDQKELEALVTESGKSLSVKARRT